MSGLGGKLAAREYDRTVLYEELQHCHCFKFVAFKHLDMPFRHTGFLLFFDNVPKYTINVRPAQDDWLQYIQSLIVTPAKITVESANDLGHVNYVGRPVVHVMDSERSREAAQSDLKTLLTPTPWYSLLTKNCRDHVRFVMRKLERDHPGIEEAGRLQLQQTHWEDAGLIALLVALVAIPVGIVMKSR